MKKHLFKVPILIFAAVVPVIMRARKIYISDELFDVYNGSRNFVDFFSYNKMVLIIISFLMALAIFLKFQDNKRGQLKPFINKLLIIFAIIIVLSSIFSKYQYIVYFGMIDRYEGMIVQLAYVFFVFYINSFVNELEDIKLIIYAIGISSSIIGVIGLLEFWGMNPFNTYFGKVMILPHSMIGFADKVKFSIKGGSISSTLYNPNFVGSYMNLTFFMGLGMLYSAHSMKKRMVWFLYTSLMLFNLIGCKSAAGKVGFIAGIIFLVIFYRKHLFSYKGIYLLVFLGIFLFLPGLIDTNSDIMSEIDKYSDSVTEEKVASKIIDNNFDVDLNKNKFAITYTDDKMKASVLNVVLEDKKLNFYNNSNSLNVKLDRNTNKLVLDKSYIDKNFIFSLSDGNDALYVSYKSKFSVILKITENGFSMNDTFLRPINKYKDFEVFKPLEGKEFIGSSRGYLWKMSIPLIKKNPILGTGPDTMGASFPQGDLVGKFKYLLNSYAYVDKPHNMYIQIGVQTGLISLIVYIMILIKYGLDTLKYYIKIDFHESIDNIGIGLFLSIFAFSFTALFNDSIISVSPLYWTMIGLGLAVNALIKKRKIEE